MQEYICMCVCVGILSSLLQAAGQVQCLEKQKVLLPLADVPQPTDCLMQCSGMTFIKKLQLQDMNNIRMHDSTEGEHGEYCWPSELKCSTIESFLSAYVVLPVDVSTVSHEQLKVKVPDPASTTTTMLHVHSRASTLADSCGPRYDVTQHFTSTRSTGTSFCIQVLTQENAPGDLLLQCPPFLVTFYLRNPSNQQSGG